MAAYRLLSCFIGLAIITAIDGWSVSPTRRAAIEQIQKISLTPFVTLLPPPPDAVAAGSTTSTPISAAWAAVDGLNSLESEKKFVSFDKSAYQAMVNDKSRTPLFEEAIINRLKSAEGGPESQVVLDLGTGPFALFAISKQSTLLSFSIVIIIAPILIISHFLAFNLPRGNNNNTSCCKEWSGESICYRS